MRYVHIGWALVLVCLLAATGSWVYNVYKANAAKCDALARSTFRKVLEQEVQKRDTVSFFYASSSGYENLSLEGNIPDSVTVTSEYGKRKYAIPLEKYHNSLVKEGRKRSILSGILEDCPLSADTVNGYWNKLLSDADVQATTHVRISVTDLLEQTSATYSKDAAMPLPTDSLLSYYMGFICEVEATGFISYHWINLVYGWYLYVCFLSFCAFVTIYCFRNKIVNRIKNSFREKEMASSRITMIEDTNLYPVYQLDVDVFFDTKREILKCNDKVATLTPQSACLLRAFLESPDRRLSISEIYTLLWPDGSGTKDRVHSAIYRLRQALKEVSCLTIDNGSICFQLKK